MAIPIDSIVFLAQCDEMSLYDGTADGQCMDQCLDLNQIDCEIISVIKLLVKLQPLHSCKNSLNLNETSVEQDIGRRKGKQICLYELQFA